MKKDIEELWSFGQNRVYILIAIARSKDNQDIQASNQPTIRKIVEDEEEITDKIEQISHATSRLEHNYRLYASINARNTQKALFLLQDKMNDWTAKVLMGDEQVQVNFKRIDHEWKSILHKPASRDDKRFLFDVDKPEDNARDTILEAVEQHTDVLQVSESPNGHHIITEPFNYNEIDVDLDYELKKDGMFFVDML